MVENLALKIAQSIKNIEPEKTASVAVMSFALQAILNTLFTIVIIGVVGWLTGALADTMIAAVAFSVFRFFSGGLHLQKALHCSIVSTILVTITPHIPLSSTGLYAVTIASLVIVLIFAPSNIRGHARIPEKYFPILKLFSALLVCSNFVFMNSIIALALFIQSLTLIRFGKEVRK